MDPISGAASIVALATVSKSIIDSGRKYVKAVRDAPDDLSRFCNELESLTILFDHLLVLQSTPQDVLFCRPGALTEIFRSAPLLENLEFQLRKIEAQIKDLKIHNIRKRLLFPLQKLQILEGLDIVGRIRSIIDSALLVDERFVSHSLYGVVKKLNATFEINQEQIMINNLTIKEMHKELMSHRDHKFLSKQLSPASCVAETKRVMFKDCHTQPRRGSRQAVTKNFLKFSFGSLSMWNKSMVESVKFDQTSREKKRSRLTMVFFPSPMFWQTLIRFQLDWATSMDFLMAPMFSLQFLDIVQDDHPIIRASRRGDKCAIEETLSQGSTSPLCSTTAGWTPLHFAAAYGQTGACKFLIAEGAPLDVTGIRGIMPLHLAAHFGHFDVFRVLLEAGSDPDDYHDHGMNAVIEICSNERASWSRNLAEFLNWLFLGQDYFLLDAQARNNNSQQTILRDLAYPPGWTSSSPQALTIDQTEAIKTILRQVVKGDELDTHEISVLHEACRDNRLDLVELLLTGDCNINVRDGSDFSPLHHAVCNKNFQIVSMLVMHKCDVSALGDLMYYGGKLRGRHTPLSLAASIDGVDMVDLLIQYGAGCYGVNVAKAFYVAVDHGSQETVQYLINTNIHQLNFFGTINLAIAHTALIEQLHEAGASINDESFGIEHPLTYAASYGYKDSVHKLIELGANLDKITNNNLTPLGHAATRGHDDIVHLLLASGAEADLTGEGQLTPWQLATFKGYHKTADIIARFSVVNQRSRLIGVLSKDAAEDETDRAEEETGGTENKANEMEAAWGREMDLGLAVRKGDLEVVERLIADSSVLTYEQMKQGSLVELAIWYRRWAVAEKLVEAGAELNVCFNDRPFLMAIRYGTVALIECMIQHGVDVQMRDDDGFTALHQVLMELWMLGSDDGRRYSEKLDILQLLLSAGADVNAMDNVRESVLGRAASDGTFEAVVKLVEAGADLNTQSRRPWSDNENYLPPIAWAAINGHTTVVKYLLDSGAEWRSLQKGPEISYTHRWLMQSWFPDNAETPRKPVHLVERPSVFSTCSFDKNRSQSSDQIKSGNKHSQVREREYQARLRNKSQRAFATIVTMLPSLSRWFRKIHDQLQSIRIEAVAFICISLLILIREAFRNQSISMLATAKVFAFTMLVAIILGSKTSQYLF